MANYSSLSFSIFVDEIGTEPFLFYAVVVVVEYVILLHLTFTEDTILYLNVYFY